jgi:exodeoxyribonuclease VII large subunit
MQTLSLFELNSLVRQVVEQTLDREYWVEAELSECRESRGHCYMELIQYDETTLSPLPSPPSPQRTPIARAQAKCWRTQWQVLQPYFERTTGQTLHAGMKVRMKVYAQFHEAYGFSWIVTDIDPTFTMGDMARRRQEIIAQLKAEGVFDMQKSLELPSFCLNIAVISSATAAGYGDFVNQLADSPFDFHTQLFPATMQGEQVEESIIAALNAIYGTSGTSGGCDTPFDCVVIIRGGGATADLSGFDTLALAENVAQFPLPIITGIGHDRDESILDMVSHTRVKTPTAAAQFLIANAEQTLLRIETCEQRILRSVQGRMEIERLRLTRLSERIPPLFSLFRTRQEARLEQLAQRLASLTERRLERENNKLETLALRLAPLATRILESHHHHLQLLEQRVQGLDPALLLKRGYSITLLDGHVLRDPQEATQDAIIETRLANGTLHSKVVS